MKHRWGVNLKTPSLPAERVSGAFAMPGEGKTELVRLLWTLFPRAIALDTQVVDGKGEYPGIVARNPRELLKGIRKRLGEPRWKISYRGDVIPAIFDALAAIPNYLLVVEEADKYGTGSHCPKGLYAMAHHGRRFGQALALVSRRPANIAKDLTATIEGLYLWRAVEPGDRDYFKKRGTPMDILDSLERHQSLRRFYGDDGTPNWSICKCNIPHLGGCQPIPGGSNGENKEAQKETAAEILNPEVAAEIIE